MTTYPLNAPSHPGTKPMSALATAAIATAATTAAAGTAVVAAGMGEWGPGDWSAFGGIVMVVGGAFVGGTLKILDAINKNHVTLRTEVRQDVQQGAEVAATKAADAAAVAVKGVEAKAAEMVPPEQLDALAERIAAKMIAARLSAPPATPPEH